MARVSAVSRGIHITGEIEMAGSRSYFHTLIACVALAVAAMVSTTVTVYRTAIRAATCTWRWIANVFDMPVVAPKPETKPLPGLAVQLIAAKQYVLRQIKRSRPVIFPSWNLSPST